MTFAAHATPNIAIVGTGPTGLYLLHHLIRAERPMIITLFEAGALAGVGMPYSPEAASVAMLANIASIEIPPLGETYLDWLERQPDTILQVYGVARETLHERQFLPRLLLGAWFRDALERMMDEAAERGHRIVLREGSAVTDVAEADEDLRVSFTVAGTETSLLFSHVILATGHSWPKEDEDEGHFVSPWSGLIETEVPAVSVGVLGSSLSGIDAAMAVACQHGSFSEQAPMRFQLRPGSEGLKITLMSRQGLLPEADFWCPLPYQPLKHFTEAALRQARDQGPVGLFDRVWRLFVRELAAEDPAWAEMTGIAHLTPDGFAEAYFAPRLSSDPFLWAEANLAEVERNTAARRTVGWRYAILRMHEPMEELVPELDPADLDRFEALKRVFIDNYAAVPPQSIRRLLALHKAGVLDVMRLGDEYELQRGPDATHVVTEEGQQAAFEIFIDARGQRPLRVADLPFPSLKAALGEPDRPVPTADDFAVRGFGGGRVFLPAAPYLLHRMPFVQGITASHDLAEAVVDSLVRPDAA